MLSTASATPAAQPGASPVRPRAALPRLAAIAVAAGLCLFGLLSVYRHFLIPGDADHESAAALLTGDEPSYLLMAQAIARGDGLDVEPANAAMTYLAFQQRPVFRFEDHFRSSYYESRGFKSLWRGAAVWKDGRITQFSPLLPAVLAPVVASASRIRWSACLLQAAFVAVCGALIVLSLGAGAGTAGVSHAAAVLVFGLGCIPAGYYASQIFPEILSGTLLLLFLFFFTSRNPAIRALALLCLLAPLWATPRVVGGVAAATAVLLWRQRATPRRAEIALLVAGWSAYAVSNMLTWGNPLPPQGSTVLHALWEALRNIPAPLLAAAVAGAAAIVVVGSVAFRKFGGNRGDWRVMPVAVAAGGLAVALTPPGQRILAGCTAFFFANSIGLLVLNPFLVIALPSGYALRREDDRGEFPVWIALVVGLVLSVAVFEEWRGGVCPSGRYQVITACTLLFAPVRVLCGRRGRPFPAWVPGMYLLGAISLTVSLIVATRPNLWYRLYHPIFGFELFRPHYWLLPDPGRWTYLPHAALWLAMLLTILLLPGRLLRRNRKS